MTPVLFAISAGVGAMARHGVNRLGWSWRGTLLVNVAGAFALGWLVATGPSEHVATVVGTGFLGALTTFSTFAFEATQGPVRQRIVVIVGTLALGLLAAVVGHAAAG